MLRSTRRAGVAATLAALVWTLWLTAGCGPGLISGAGADAPGGERAPSSLSCSAPGTNLQAVLDAGKDLALCPGGVYELNTRLQYKAAGQTISTVGAKHPRDYATLRLIGSAIHAVYSEHLDNVVLEKVIVDGNRQALGVFTGPAETNLALVLMVEAKGQTVRNTVLKNTRTWSSLQPQESRGQCLAARPSCATTWCSTPPTWASYCSARRGAPWKTTTWPRSPARPSAAWRWWT